MLVDKASLGILTEIKSVLKKALLSGSQLRSIPRFKKHSTKVVANIKTLDRESRGLVMETVAVLQEEGIHQAIIVVDVLSSRIMKV